jgi:hypothetical protein
MVTQNPLQQSKKGYVSSKSLTQRAQEQIRIQAGKE